MGHTYGGSTSQARPKASMDCSAAADGRRAFQLGFTRSQCPYRGHRDKLIPEWLRGFDEEAAKAAPQVTQARQ